MKENPYKRSGIDITNNQANNAASRISVGTDSNNDLQLRSNNSIYMTTTKNTYQKEITRKLHLISGYFFYRTHRIKIFFELFQLSLQAFFSQCFSTLVKSFFSRF
jgi:hypothetical protein